MLVEHGTSLLKFQNGNVLILHLTSVSNRQVCFDAEVRKSKDCVGYLYMCELKGKRCTVNIWHPRWEGSKGQLTFGEGAAHQTLNQGTEFVICVPLCHLLPYVSLGKKFSLF